MKKTYTKKQITEAIAYWKNKLKAMNEGWSEDVMGPDPIDDVDQILDEIDTRDRQEALLKSLIDMIISPKNYKVLEPILDSRSEYDDIIALFAGIIEPFAKHRKELSDFINRK